MTSVDVIIPVYKPDKTFGELMKRLSEQTLAPNKIILMNTEQKYFDSFVFGTSFLEKYKNIEVRHVSKKEFDHGRTRDLGIKRSNADYFVLMTMDALPKDVFLIEQLVSALQEKENCAIAYARQLPRADSNIIERFGRSFNYPAESSYKTKEDIKDKGIKAFFCSNVCAAYKRSVYDELGGFCRHTIFNEDMIFARKALEAGYGIAYEANARVIHSHNYSAMEQLHRNFDLGVSQADHPEVFANISSESEGKKLVSMTISHLINEKKPYLIPGYIINTGCRYVGYLLGKRYRIIPKPLIKKLSMNPDYWHMDTIVKDNSHIDPTKGYGKTEEELAHRNRNVE